MSRNSRLAIAAALLAISLVSLPAFGAGGSSAPTPPVSPPTLTPEQQAAEDYNSGLRHRDAAWKLEEKIAAGDGDAAKMEKKLGKTWARAIRDFRSATRNNPRLHQAWSSLGYALRKTGDYTASLEAYDRALQLAPGYAEAIEYRAEAYLALDRLEEAKQAYMALFAGDRARADELMKAMEAWVEEHRSDPGGLDGSTVDAFASWVEERAELAGQTETVSQLRDRPW